MVILFAHLLLHGLVTGILALYVGIFLRSNNEFGWEWLGMLTLVFFSFTGVTLAGLSIMKTKSCIITSFNELLKMKRSLTLSGKVLIK